MNCSKTKREGRRTLHGNDETALALDHLSNHVVNKTVLVPKALGLKVLLVILFIDLLEDILESSIVFLEDGVLSAHVQGQFLEKSHLETGMSEANDRLVCIVLGLRNTRAGEVVYLNTFWLTIFGG